MDGRKLASWCLMGVLAAVLTGCGDDDVLVGPPPGQATVTVTAPASPTDGLTPSPTPSPTDVPATPTTDTPPAVDLSQPPTTYDEAVAHVDAGTDRGDLTSFVTPSGNIFCALTLDGLPTGCELGGGAIEDPATCADTGSRAVGRIELDGGVATALCNTDTIRVSEPAAVLGYGEVATTRDTRCISEELGVTCVARNGNGAFFLRRGQYALLSP